MCLSALLPLPLPPAPANYLSSLIFMDLSVLNISYTWNPYSVTFSDCLLSFIKMISSFIQLFTILLFPWPNYIPLYGISHLSICSLTDGHLSSKPSLPHLVVLRTEHMLGKDALSLSYALSPNPL